MNIAHAFRRNRQCRGFSLVEVTIAMAIAAVAVATLMGMIPQGIETMREAGDEAIIGRIHQQVLNELQMADFDALDEYDSMEIFFDSQGEELSDSKSQGSVPEERKKGSFPHVYTAKITLPKRGDSFPESVGGGTFDGVSFDKGDTVNGLLRPVVIEVAAVSGLANEFDWGEEHRGMIKTYQTNVVKMGQAFRQ